METQEGMSKHRRRRSRGGKIKRKISKKGIELIEAESITNDEPQNLYTKASTTDVHVHVHVATDKTVHNGTEAAVTKTDKEKSKKTGKKGKKKEDMVNSTGGEMTDISEKKENKQKKNKVTSKMEETDEKLMSTSGKKRKRNSKQHSDGPSSNKVPKLNQDERKDNTRADTNAIKNGKKTDKLYMKQKKKTTAGSKSEAKMNKKPTKVHKDVFNFATPKDFLASLIAPTSVKKFFRVFWEKKPMVINRTDEAYAESYKSLFSRKILEQILNKRNIEFVKDVNVCKFDGKVRTSMNGEGRASSKKIKTLLDKERATVQFHQPQRFQDKLWQINEQLESFFHSLVGANIYMTPQDSQGLAPHYDDVDVFVLQLEGEKKWRLYDPPIQLPRDYSKDLDKSTIGKPTHNILLKAGDLMYFPRGTVHQAVTPAYSPTHSTHVTISTYQRSSWGDLISMALPGMLQTALESDVDFRRGLPHNYLNGDQESFTTHQSHLKKMVQCLSEHLGSHDQAAANEMMCDLVANRLPPYMKDGAAHEPKGPMPTEKSKVKLAFPEHIYVTQTKHSMMDKPDDEEEDEDFEPGEESMEDDDDDDDDDESEDDEEDEEEDGEDQEEEEQEESDDSNDGDMAVADGSYLEQILAGEDEEDSDEDDEDDQEADYFYVYHSIKNKRNDHMMTSEPPQWHGLKFPIDWMATMKQLTDNRDDWTSISELEDPNGRMQLVVSLWSEGLLQVN